MRSDLECVPCFFAQAVRAARQVGLDDGAARQLVDELGARLAELDQELPPPRNARLLYDRLAELSGTADPFAAAKARHTALALELVPELQRRLAAAPDPLDTALRLAAAGNILDLGAMARVERVEEVIEQALVGEHPCWQVELLRGRLAGARSLLVVGDNAGETVFDRLLLETVAGLYPELERLYAVRGGPVINDATLADARAAGILEVAEVVSTGSAVPGVALDLSSPEFRAAFAGADVIVAKGQGNFETLNEVARELFFVLTVKCRVVSRHLGLPCGASVLVHHEAAVDRDAEA